MLTYFRRDERVIVRIDFKLHPPFAYLQTLADGLQKTDQAKCASEQVRLGVLNQNTRVQRDDAWLLLFDLWFESQVH